MKSIIVITGASSGFGASDWPERPADTAGGRSPITQRRLVM